MDANGAGIAAGRFPESRREDKAVVLDVYLAVSVSQPVELVGPTR